MTDLETGPSSIRDDSICESSLRPNKSSGDIGERTWTPEQFWEFAAAFLGDHEATTSRTMIEDRGLVLIPAAEIERLRRELDAANSNHRSMAHQLAETGIRLEHAESAVAAAWEEAAKVADERASREKRFQVACINNGDHARAGEHAQARVACDAIASAIRAAGAENIQK